MYKRQDNRCTDVYFNLAVEEYLLKQTQWDYFVIWQSEPSVVMGKNQSVRAEVNEDYRIEKGIRLARRFSGGGAAVSYTHLDVYKRQFSYHRFLYHIRLFRYLVCS